MGSRSHSRLSERFVLALAAWAPLLFVVLWASGFIASKYGLRHAEPLSFLVVRYLLVIGLMAAVAVASKAPWPSGGRQWLHIGIAGLLVHGVYLGGVFVAMALGLPAGVTSLIVSIQPLLTAAIIGYLLRQPVTPWQWTGLILGFTGVALVVAGKLGTQFGPAALAAALAALLGITLGTLYQKRFCPRFDWRTGAVAQFLPTLLATALAAALTEDFRIHWVPEFVFALAWSVLVLSLGAISLLNFLIHRDSAMNLASLFYLVPPCTALIAWVLFDEIISGWAIVGMAMAVVGVYLSRK